LRRQIASVTLWPQPPACSALRGTTRREGGRGGARPSRVGWREPPPLQEETLGRALSLSSPAAFRDHERHHWPAATMAGLNARAEGPSNGRVIIPHVPLAALCVALPCVRVHFIVRFAARTTANSWGGCAIRERVCDEQHAPPRRVVPIFRLRSCVGSRLHICGGDCPNPTRAHPSLAVQP
jgi:hypothetical protein